MSNLINPWDMASDLNEAVIPQFVQAKYMVLRIAPPKGKEVVAGLLATCGLMSYVGENGTEVKMIEVSEGPSGYSVEFPNGKRGITATKYRGPKSWYRFRKEDGSWFQIGSNDRATGINNKFTPEYAEKHLESSIKGWDQISEADRKEMIEEYLYDMFLFALALDFNLKVEGDDLEMPFVGMVSDLYRRYTPPKDGEKYGNTVITKFAPSEGRETLSGDYTKVDAEIAAAVHAKIQERDEARFDPADFAKKDAKEDVI